MITATFDYAAQPMERIACPLCRTTTPSTPQIDRFGFTVGVSACACGMEYLNPRLTADGYDTFYREHYRPLVAQFVPAKWKADRMAAERVQRGRELAGQLFTRGVRSIDALLDVGGSTGDVATGIADVLPVGRATIVDPNPDEILQADAHGWTGVWGSAEDVPDVGTFDGIVCTQTADHWRDPLAALRWMRTCAKPNAWLSIDIVDRDRWRQRAPKAHAYKVDHPLYWTLATLGTALTQTGWTLETPWTPERYHWHRGWFCRAKE